MEDRLMKIADDMAQPLIEVARMQWELIKILKEKGILTDEDLERIQQAGQQRPDDKDPNA